MSDDAKKVILARRARFMAAAVASVGIACGKETKEPPMPCLSVAYVPEDASTTLVPLDADADAAAGAGADADAGADAGADAAADAGARRGGVKPVKPPTTGVPVAPPMPCLKPLPPKSGR